MPNYFVFLRAVNVGGRTVKMDRLKLVLEQIGARNVTTFIASGNARLDIAGSAAAARKRIEVALSSAFGLEIDTFLRTPSELHRSIDRQPFSPRELDAAEGLCIAFMHQPLKAPARKTLAGLETKTDKFVALGTELYWLHQTRQSESKISNKVLERALGIRLTIRNHSTLERFIGKYT